MAIRYLEADKVTLPARAPLFVEPGHCQWCNKELTGKAKYYCRPTEEWKRLYRYNYVEPVVSECYLRFSNYWYSRPAYVRATFIRDRFTCQECGLQPWREDKPWLPDISQLECDHIIPLARGGRTEMTNLQTLCRECNRKKGTKVDGEVDLPKVVALRDETKCPQCRARGYLELPWEVPDGYDPLMKKVQCLACGEESYIGPAPLHPSVHYKG